MTAEGEDGVMTADGGDGVTTTGAGLSQPDSRVVAAAAPTMNAFKTTALRLRGAAA